MPLPYRILVVQVVTAAVVSSSLCWIGAESALGAMTAAVVVIVPNAWFAWRVVAGGTPRGDGLTGAGLAQAQARSIVSGGVAKLVATGVLMAVAIAWLQPQPFAFFGTLIGLQAAYWFAPLLDGPPRSRQRKAE